MKVYLLNFFIVATVFLVSAALPQDRGKDRPSLIDSESQENEKPLQRRKPPIKIPGPKLRNTEDEETVEKPNTKSLAAEELKMKQLSDEDKKKWENVNLTKENKNNKDLPSLDDDSKGDEKERKRKGKNRNSRRKNEQNGDDEDSQEEKKE